MTPVASAVASAVTPVASARPCALRAVLSLFLRASPVPSAVAKAVMPVSSVARTLVSALTKPPLRRASVLERMSTLSGMVAAAIATAFLYLVCLSLSKSAFVSGNVTIKLTKYFESFGATGSGGGDKTGGRKTQMPSQSPLPHASASTASAAAVLPLPDVV